MTQDTQLYIMIASLALVTVTILALTAVRLWNEWMAYKHAELNSYQNENSQPAPTTMSRIEVADLKERVRKLEAIAAGIDL